jgi:hypothetical protein
MTLLNKSLKNINKVVSSKNISSMKTYEILLVVVLVLYIVSGVSTPYELSPYVNNTFMNLSLLALVIVLYLYGNPLLAVVVAIVAAVFINRSRKVDHRIMKPSQENKNSTMKKLNSHLNVKSLEEEMVGDILKKPDNTPGPSSYHPVLCASHNASNLD